MLFRALAFVALGVVLGFLLGGVGPRRELQKQERELAELKESLSRSERPNPLRELLPALMRSEREGARGRPSKLPEGFATTPDNGETRAEAETGPAQRSAQTGSGALIIRGSEAPGTMRAGGAEAEGEVDNDDGEVDSKLAQAEAKRPRRDRDFRSLNLARFDELSAAQAMRFAASRAALIEQAGLNEDETKAVDQTVKKMNDDLSGYGEEILSQAAAEKPPSPSQALGLGHDVTGIMYEGQQQIEKIIGSRADSVEPEAMQIWNFVDMERLRPAAEKFLPKDEAEQPAGQAEPAPSKTESKDGE